MTEKRDIFSRSILWGLENPKLLGKDPAKRLYERIRLTNELIITIAEIYVCAKFEENLVTVATNRARIHYIFLNLFENTVLKTVKVVERVQGLDVISIKIWIGSFSYGNCRICESYAKHDRTPRL